MNQKTVELYMSANDGNSVKLGKAKLERDKVGNISIKLILEEGSAAAGFFNDHTQLENIYGIHIDHVIEWGHETPEEGEAVLERFNEIPRVDHWDEMEQIAESEVKKEGEL